jgi:hypothetical protein
MQKKKELPQIEISELYLVKADWERTFIAEIFKEKTEDDNEVHRGKVVIDEGMAWSVGESQEELGNYLDDICTMKLDKGLHSHTGVTMNLFGEDFFLN